MSDLIEDYQKTLDEQIDGVARYILNGRCCDHPEYLARISEIKAYKRAKDNFRYELDKYIHDEDNLTSEEDDNE